MWVNRAPIPSLLWPRRLVPQSSLSITKRSLVSSWRHPLRCNITGYRVEINKILATPGRSFSNSSLPSISTLSSANDNNAASRRGHQSAHPLDSFFLQSFPATATVSPNEESELSQSHPTTPEQRARAILSIYVALANEANSIMGSHTRQQTRKQRHSRHTRRGFSSVSPKDGSTTDQPPAESLPPRTEPDFADLSGKTEEQGQEFETPHTAQPETPIPNIRLVGTTTLDDYSATARVLRRNQQHNLDEARAKTAANVRRALAGNMVICVAKLAAWTSSGSSSMLSEFVHSVVDCGNQSLLLLGLRDSGNVADRIHPYGYGKSVYFWALVSALGTFFLGAGVSVTYAVGELMAPSLNEITWHVWGVLGLSLAVDGWVLGKTVSGILETMPSGVSFYSHVWTIRDPATLAILLEDGAACLGILMAIAGIAATHATNMSIFDGLAGFGISGLLAAMGIILVRVNHRFLLGQAVDRDIIEGIEKILLNRRSIDNVHSVQSQWTGPDTFSYKAEVDFDGTYLAAKLMPRYQQEFLEVRDSLDQELRVLLSWYAEDVMRTVEREVRHIESDIRKVYPGAEFIELEPMSKDADRFAIDDGMEAQLRRIEIDSLNRYLKSLYQTEPKSTKPKDGSSVDETSKPSH